MPDPRLAQIKNRFFIWAGGGHRPPLAPPLAQIKNRFFIWARRIFFDRGAPDLGVCGLGDLKAWGLEGFKPSCLQISGLVGLGTWTLGGLKVWRLGALKPPSLQGYKLSSLQAFKPKPSPALFWGTPSENYFTRHLLVRQSFPGSLP